MNGIKAPGHPKIASNRSLLYLFARTKPNDLFLGGWGREESSVSKSV